MKRISAVICELNPLHDGHRYVFSKAKENSDILIAVMSGNFVQRGETAVYHKYKRAEAALSAGADLVLEIPFPFCASSAEFFAAAGVRIAESIGSNVLYFGSECGDINALKNAGSVLDSEEYRAAMIVGRSASLRADLLKKYAPELPGSLLNSPNDILAAEYCRRAKIETVAIKRISTESASAIRKRTIGGSDSDMLDPYKLMELEYIHFRTLRNNKHEYAECGGGVFERLYNTAFSTTSPGEWFDAVKTKQYTNSRLRRAALYVLCSVTPEELKREVLYTNVLGANTKGREYLSAIRKKCDFCVITNNSEKKNTSADVKNQIELSDHADSIYELIAKEKEAAFFLKQHPVITR